MKRITSFLIALIMCASINMLSVDLSAAEEKALTLTPEQSAVIEKWPAKEKAAWERLSDKDKDTLIKGGYLSTAFPEAVPCGIAVTDVIGWALGCYFSKDCSSIPEKIFDKCCPSGSGFAACADPFLKLIATLEPVKVPFPVSKSLADILFTIGFNAKACGINARIPHLAMLAGGDPAGNIKNCVATIFPNASANAKTWIEKCVSGPGMASYTECANPRYQALQLGLNWGGSQVDCGGTYAADCNKPACPAKWGTACN